MVAEIFEYPFDLAKVRLQAQVLTPASSNITRFNGPLHCLMQTWKEEGVRGLYRVRTVRFIRPGYSAYGSLGSSCSSCRSHGRNSVTLFRIHILPELHSQFRCYGSECPAYYPSTRPCGWWCRICHQLCPVRSLSFMKAVPEPDIARDSTPIELVKCKMQVQMMNFRPLDPPSPGRIPRRPATITTGGPTLHGTGGKATSLNPLYSNHDRSALHHSACTKSHTLPAAAVNIRPPGAIALVRSIVDTYGVRGLWLGHTGTILRETGSSAAWFVTKEWVARKLIERRVHPIPHLGHTAKLEPTSMESAVSGAVAGAVGALLFYPADTVKSAIQTEEELRPQSYNSKGQKAVFPKSTFIGTAKMMYVRHGLKGLYAGCGMTVARAVPSSCIIFVVYDKLMSLFP